MGIAAPLIHVNRGMAARRLARITKGIAGTGETAYFAGVRSFWRGVMTATR